MTKKLRTVAALPLAAIRAAVEEATLEAWRQTRALTILLSRRRVN